MERGQRDRKYHCRRKNCVKEEQWRSGVRLSKKRSCIMEDHQELLQVLNAKIDECDDLIVEISQLRYHLEDIVKVLNSKPGKKIFRGPGRTPSLKKVV